MVVGTIGEFVGGCMDTLLWNREACLYTKLSDRDTTLT